MDPNLDEKRSANVDSVTAHFMVLAYGPYS
ncbi:hypothetical protein EV281_104238 [Rhizobium sp. BK418]|nr:hypothetical protein EV281_104238 [Rhizobium sp. BK418]